MPKYLSSDNDPLYRFHRWQANLRVLEVTEIKSIPYVPLSHPFVERLTTLRPFDASIWIACCSGPLQISKTSCSISGPTSTTSARIPHWKGEPRIRRCHDQSQISAHFDGNLTVVTYIRHQWLRNFPKTLDRCVSGQPWGNLQLNHLVFAFLWLRASRIRSFLFHPLSIRQRPCYSAKVPS